MPRYSNCRVCVTDETGAPPFEDDDGDVELAPGGILVAYFDDRGPVVMQGVETQTGRFELKARSRPRKAELALEGSRLEGRWWEATAAGTLEIELGTEEEDA